MLCHFASDDIIFNKKNASHLDLDDENCRGQHFVPFLGHLEASKLYKTFVSCTGGSKLLFGWPYVKIH